MFDGRFDNLTWLLCLDIMKVCDSGSKLVETESEFVLCVCFKIVIENYAFYSKLTVNERVLLPSLVENRKLEKER